MNKTINIKDKWHDQILVMAHKDNRTFSNMVETLIGIGMEKLLIPNKILPLIKSAQHLLHLHTCEQEGISSGMPTPQQWLKGVEDLHREIETAKLWLANNQNKTASLPALPEPPPARNIKYL